MSMCGVPVPGCAASPVCDIIAVVTLYCWGTRMNDVDGVLLETQFCQLARVKSSVDKIFYEYFGRVFVAFENKYICASAIITWLE